MNIFERAARAKLRFATPNGLMTTEQLFELPLVAKGERVSLDSVARTISANLKQFEESFVDATPNPNKVVLELAMEVVKHVIAAKQNDMRQAEQAAATAERRKVLENALADKSADAIKNMSKDDIEKELAALKAA